MKKTKSVLRIFGINCSSELYAILNKTIKQYYYDKNILSTYCQIIEFDILKLIFEIEIHEMRKYCILKHNKNDLSNDRFYTL